MKEYSESTASKVTYRVCCVEETDAPRYEGTHADLRSAGYEGIREVILEDEPARLVSDII